MPKGALSPAALPAGGQGLQVSLLHPRLLCLSSPFCALSPSICSPHPALLLSLPCPPYPLGLDLMLGWFCLAPSWLATFALLLALFPSLMPPRPWDLCPSWATLRAPGKWHKEYSTWPALSYQLLRFANCQCLRCERCPVGDPATYEMALHVGPDMQCVAAVMLDFPHAG